MARLANRKGDSLKVVESNVGVCSCAPCRQGEFDIKGVVETDSRVATSGLRFSRKLSAMFCACCVFVSYGTSQGKFCLIPFLDSWKLVINIPQH